MTFLGMDVDAVDGLTNQIQTQVDRLNGVINLVDNSVQTLSSLWYGGDLEHFQANWYSQRPMAQAVAADLAAAVGHLQAEIGQQRAASDDSPGGVHAVGGGTGSDSKDGANPWEVIGSGIDDANMFFALQGLTAAGLNVAGMVSFYGSDTGKLMRSMGGTFTDQLTHYSQLAKEGEGNTFAKASRLVQGEDWASALKGGMSVENAAGNAGKAADFIGKAGKALGPLGVAFGVAGTAADFIKGDYARGTYDGVTTGLAFAALVTPPPADVVCGVAAGAMAGAEFLYDNVPAVHEVADAVGSTVSDVASGVGSAVSDVASGIGDALSSIF